MKTLYLLRHGATEAGPRYIGATDIGIARSSQGQLARVGQRLAQVGIERILCSPMTRCVESAKHLALLAPIQMIAELREVDFGLWEKKTFAEIASGWPELVRHWAVFSEDFTFPEGERVGDFLSRVASVRRQIEECEAQTMLIVSHGGVIRHLICSFLGLRPHRYLLFEVEAGHFATLALHSEGGVLTSLNSGGGDG